jgi:D-alanyl-D-alanine carboxypeptidase (penicillin-binding protein 5/6)
LSITRLVAVSATATLVWIGTAGSAWGAHAAAPSEGLSCESCLLVDDRDRVLFERSPGRRLPNASTTKMATAIVVVESTPLERLVEVSAKAAGTGGGGFDLQAGEAYTVGDLLYALLLDSSNDAAVALAEHVSGSEEAFVAEMNELAADLGALRTRFVTAHGLDTEGHYSTAADLVRISEDLLRHPELAAIVATAETTITGPGGPRRVDNRNVLLDSYRGMIGVKTGYTLGAGEVLVGAARRGGRRLIAVAMRSDDAARDVRRLLDYGFARLARTVLVPDDSAVAAVVFDSSGAVTVAPDHVVRGLADPERIHVEVVPAQGVTAPVEAGERVGEVVTTQGERRVSAEAAVASRPGRRAGPSWIARVLAALLGAFGALVGRGG